MLSKNKSKIKAHDKNTTENDIAPSNHKNNGSHES